LIVTTACAGENVRELLLEAGACRVVEKPVDYDRLVRNIAQCHAAHERGGAGSKTARVALAQVPGV
jgi:hypothetical protein